MHEPNTTLEQHLKSLKNASQQANMITMDTASKIVDEYRDKERRQWNLIVYNVPEPESANSTVRKASDRDFFNSLVNTIGVGPVDIADIVRLGSKTPNKIRPLRVQCNNMKQRRSVLANAKKLRDASSSIFKKVYVNPDLSQKQRQIQRDLRQEVARRKEAGETGLFIRRGRIVKQSRPSSHPPTVAGATECIPTELSITGTDFFNPLYLP